MNLPNTLTASRIVLSLVFLFCIFQPGLAAKLASFGLFALACVTDYADGHLARRHNQITPLGQLLDPVADKVMMFAAFLAFVEMGIVPAWMVAAMLAREILLTGFRLHAAGRGVVIPAGRGGKHKTFLQACAIFIILAYLILIETSFWRPEWYVPALGGIQAFMWVVVLVTLGTGIYYTAKNWGRIHAAKV